MWKWALWGLAFGSLMKPMGAYGPMDPSTPAWWLSKIILMVFWMLAFMAAYGIRAWWKRPSVYEREQR